MEDLEWRNAMQFMLLVYLDEKRWAKIPEDDERVQAETTRVRAAELAVAPEGGPISLARTFIDEKSTRGR